MKRCYSPRIVAELATLQVLAVADDATFDSSDTREPCIPGTRSIVLDMLYEWATNPTAKQVFWLNGHAGSGKSTIAQSFAELLRIEGLLGASFFCSRDSLPRRNLKSVMPVIAFQLATGSNPASARFRECTVNTLMIKPKIASLSLQNQFEQLLIRPVNESQMTTVIVIDALDECTNDIHRADLLNYRITILLPVC